MKFLMLTIILNISNISTLEEMKTKYIYVKAKDISSIRGEHTVDLKNRKYITCDFYLYETLYTYSGTCFALMNEINDNL